MSRQRRTVFWGILQHVSEMFDPDASSAYRSGRRNRVESLLLCTSAVGVDGELDARCLRRLECGDQGAALEVELAVITGMRRVITGVLGQTRRISRRVTAVSENLCSAGTQASAQGRFPDPLQRLVVWGGERGGHGVETEPGRHRAASRGYGEGVQIPLGFDHFTDGRDPPVPEELRPVHGGERVDELLVIRFGDSEVAIDLAYHPPGWASGRVEFDDRAPPPEALGAPPQEPLHPGEFQSC